MEWVLNIIYNTYYVQKDKKTAKKLSLAKARKIARQDGAGATLGSNENSPAARKQVEGVDHLISDSSTESK